MPTLFRLFGFRFFYRLYDLINEPCHVHIGDDARKLCKYWLFADGGIELADQVGFTKRELGKIEKALAENIYTIRQMYENDCAANNVRPNYKSKKS